MTSRRGKPTASKTGGRRTSSSGLKAARRPLSALKSLWTKNKPTTKEGSTKETAKSTKPWSFLKALMAKPADQSGDGAAENGGATPLNLGKAPRAVPLARRGITEQVHEHQPSHMQGGLAVGAISDSSEALMAAVGKADITSARKLEAALADLSAFEIGSGQGIEAMANRIENEFPADSGVSELLAMQAQVHSRFAEDIKAVQMFLRKAHPHEWERIENPRTGEQAWDLRENSD
jgi:hypothetical protein